MSDYYDEMTVEEEAAADALFQEQAHFYHYPAPIKQRSGMEIALQLIIALVMGALVFLCVMALVV